MPLRGRVRYRWKHTKHGKIRLAFRGNKVIETKKGKHGEPKRVS